MLLVLRAEQHGKSITELSRDLEIPKSSAFQIAATLVHHGLLECDAETRRYRPGDQLIALAGGARGRPDVAALAVPHLQALAEDTGLTALLGLPSAHGVVLAGRADSPQPLSVSAPVGYELDRMAGAFGKVFAAALDDEQRRSLLRAGLPRYTARSIVKFADMERELERVRRHGVATDVEEYLDGIRAVAAPVLDAGGQVVAALCVLGVAARLKRARLNEAAGRVKEGAAALSADLGAPLTEAVA
jgi:IclR family acetate operon transcriptional repressor